MTISVFYDGDCPFCSKYMSLIRLKETLGEVKLVDLRANPDVKDELLSQGFNLDKGMVVDIDGRRVEGAEAVNQMALLSTPSNGFNRFNKKVMSSPFLAALLYPFLRAGRWLVLFFLGREQISPDDEGTIARASIFGSMFALFSMFHFFNYAIEYGRFPPQLDMMIILFAAILLFLNPRSSRFLFILMAVSTVSAIIQAPVSSNHTIVRNFVLLGYWMSFIYAMFRSLKWSDVFTNFTMAGQASLLVMYFFGVFHKINSDFLNPEVSCAVGLWQKMPWPLYLVDHPVMHYLAIYGTFAVETILVLMLFTKRFRHIAVVFGILFHLLLAMSSYAMYISFTTLAISLHCLFLNEESAQKIQNSAFMQAVRKRVMNPAYIVLGLVLTLCMVVAGMMRQYSIVTVLMLPLVLPFCFAVMRYGASDKPLQSLPNRVPSTVIGVFLGGLFFLNCCMPYLGLKSAQTVNMFANIRLEGGVSNHLIMNKPKKMFNYLDDVIIIDSAEGSRSLKYYEKNNHKAGMVYYAFLDQMDRHPDAVVSYRRGGEKFVDITKADLKEDIETTLHPKWFRKWFHFSTAELEYVRPCF